MRKPLLMQIIEEPFEDIGEPDGAGQYYSHYSGVIYRFIFPEREFRVRLYDQATGEAHFLSYRLIPSHEHGLFESIPYDDPDFTATAFYARDSLGAGTVSILLPGGYVPIDFTRFAGPPPLHDPELFHCFRCRAAIPAELDRCPACGWTWQQSEGGEQVSSLRSGIVTSRLRSANAK